MSAGHTLFAGLVTCGFLFARPSLIRADEPLHAAQTPQAAEAIRLLDSPDVYHRQLGFLRLEALRDPATANVIRAYLTNKDPDTRAFSLRALVAIEGLAAAPVALERLRTDPHPRVRRSALLGLEVYERGNPNILPAFLRALQDPDTEVRLTAVDVVSRIDDPRAREAILTRSARERRSDVRRVLALAMKRITK